MRGIGKPEGRGQPSVFKIAKSKNRSRFAGDFLHNIVSGVSTAAGAFSGFKALGPAGVAGGAAAGGAAAAYAKHAATSWVAARSGPSVGSSGSVAELKSAVFDLVDSVRTECDAHVQTARGQVEEALETIQRATEGSSSSLVDDTLGSLEEGLEKVDEILTASDSAKSNAEVWSNGL